MGYRELLKKYIRYLELHTGDNYIEAIGGARESLLSERDIAELRTLAGEIFREAHSPETTESVANYNYRFRLLFNRYGLSITRASMLAGVDAATIGRWRTSPQSKRYLAMTERQFARFERTLIGWIEQEESTNVVGSGASRRT